MGSPTLRLGFRVSRKAFRSLVLAFASRETLSDLPEWQSRPAEASPTLRWGGRASRKVLRRSVWVFALRDGLSGAPFGLSRLAAGPPAFRRGFASRGKSNDHEIGLARMIPWLEAERGRSIRNSRSDMIMKRNNKMKSVFSPLWMALLALLVFLPACGDDFEETDLTGTGAEIAIGVPSWAIRCGSISTVWW